MELDTLPNPRCSLYRFSRRFRTVRRRNGKRWLLSCTGATEFWAPNEFWMVLSSKATDSASRDQNLASNAATRKPPRGNQVIDRTNAQTERFGGIPSRIQQLLY